jgi:GntR family transcriptional regulator/MocR family aminotransferase
LEKQFLSELSKKTKHKIKKPLYQILFEALKEVLTLNHLPEGCLLPPTRKLAKRLNLSRSTVVKSYELLRLEGFVTSTTGSGFQIKLLDNAASMFPLRINPYNKYPALSNLAEAFKTNMALINSIDDTHVAFRPGLPPLDLFPVNHWKNLTNQYWRHIKSSALSYSPATGLIKVKESLAHYLNLSRGIKCHPEQIVVVSGSLQSLFLIGSVLINPGDTVLQENPTFPNVHSIFKGLRAKIKGIDVDEEGLQVMHLPLNTESCKLIHVTPSCHYPTGAIMSETRKQGLLSWANKENAIIIENDYEHEINNFHQQRPSLFSLDKQQRTIFLGTFNRLLHPSTRVGYMVLPPYLIEPVSAFLKHSHRFVPTSTQVVLNEFIQKKYLHAHVKNVVHAAEVRLTLFENLFQKYLGDAVKLSHSAAPSLHNLALLPAHLNDQEITQTLGKQNLMAHSYQKCFGKTLGKPGLIMGYTAVREPVLKKYVKLFTDALAPFL